eukprot:SAG11_NODE_490_length_8982_cov_5.961162_8_plen_217_part_00
MEGICHASSSAVPTALQTSSGLGDLATVKLTTISCRRSQSAIAADPTHRDFKNPAGYTRSQATAGGKAAIERKRQAGTLSAFRSAAGRAAIEQKRQAGTLSAFQSAAGKATKNKVRLNCQSSTPRFEVFGPGCTPKGELVDDEGVVVKTLLRVEEVLELNSKCLSKQKIVAGTGLRKGWSWLRNDNRLTKTLRDHKIFIQPKDDWTWQGDRLISNG